MPSKSDHVPPDDGLKKIEATLALIRAAAKTPASWLKRTFNLAAQSSRQSDGNVALADALAETVAAFREMIANQQVRLEHLERDLTELRAVSTSLRELQERSAAAETQLAQLRQGQAEKMDQLSAEQDGLGSELRERIQHLIDEQRICIRQLSLKTSEEAVLAERARRATELRLEEIERRVPKQSA